MVREQMKLLPKKHRTSVIHLCPPFIAENLADEEDLAIPILEVKEMDYTAGFGSLESAADWLAKEWLNKPADRKKLRTAWKKLKPRIEEMLRWEEGVMGGPYLALLVYMRLWSTDNLYRLKRCALPSCGRIFFARKAQKYCRRRCLNAKILASYGTDEYRKKKRLAMRRGREIKSRTQMSLLNQKPGSPGRGSAPVLPTA